MQPVRKPASKSDAGAGSPVFAGIVLFISLVVVGVVVLFSNRRAEQARALAAERQRYLTACYGPENAGRLMRGMFWQGMTRDMLIASRGHPVDIDQVVMKTRFREVFKYHQIGVNRFRLRVTLDNGIVVGWEDKR